MNNIKSIKISRKKTSINNIKIFRIDTSNNKPNIKIINAGISNFEKLKRIEIKRTLNRKFFC